MTVAEVAESGPFHLRGNFAPVAEEVEAVDLPVEGSIPREIAGRYLRNGPNPKTGTSPHWFFGDGMLHGIALRDGKAQWYRNRWVRTRQFLEDAQFVSPDGTVDRTVGAANTHVVCHAGRILALVESSFPTEVGPDLDTVGTYDFGGRLTTAMTAHPKLCPTTGEMHFFGYGFMPPFLTYHRADRDGNLVQSEVIDVPGPTMIHDFAITATQVVFMDLPIVFDLELAMQGTMPYRWSDDYGARVGIMPRNATAADVRWFDVEPCYVFHPLNAFDDGDRVIVDIARYPELWRTSPQDFSPALLHRWTVDPAAGKVIEEPLDDRPIEFPRVDERLVGLPHRYGYGLHTTPESGELLGSSVLLKYDLATGATRVHDFGSGRVPSEGVFIPAADDADEDEGWVVTYVYDAARDRSDFVVIDASDFTAPPVATVLLPQRVPFGFHGSWVPDSAL
jgi:carotenoid cleavage dioxygenase-like enzyme